MRNYTHADELYHWKYTKREWKNGRWKYYYNDKEIKVANAVSEKAGINAKTRYEQAAKELERLEFDPKDAIVRDGSKGEYKPSWKLTSEVVARTRHPEGLHLQKSGGDRHSEYREHYNKAMELDKAGREYVQAYKEYQKTPISKIDAVAAKGKAFVETRRKKR